MLSKYSRKRFADINPIKKANLLGIAGLKREKMDCVRGNPSENSKIASIHIAVKQKNMPATVNIPKAMLTGN